jgi:opacity protein-like surface antigen
MKKAFIGMFLLSFLVAAVPNAHAHLEFYLGIQGGVSLQEASLDAVKTIKFNQETTFLYGLRAGIKIAMIAAEASYYQTAYHLNPEDISEDMWKNREVGYSYYGVSGKFLLPIPFLSPYITVGYGYYTTDIHSLRDFKQLKQKKHGLNFGAGVELALGKFSIIAEGRYHNVTFDFGEDLTFDPGHFTLHGGFNVYF